MTRTQQHRSTVSVADAIRATVNPAHLKCEPWASIIARAEALEALVEAAGDLLHGDDIAQANAKTVFYAALARVREAK